MLWCSSALESLPCLLAAELHIYAWPSMRAGGSVGFQGRPNEGLLQLRYALPLYEPCWRGRADTCVEPDARIMLCLETFACSARKRVMSVCISAQGLGLVWCLCCWAPRSPQMLSREVASRQLIWIMGVVVGASLVLSSWVLSCRMSGLDLRYIVASTPCVAVLTRLTSSNAF